jgi:hypothetical protein
LLLKAEYPLLVVTQLAQHCLVRGIGRTRIRRVRGQLAGQLRVELLLHRLELEPLRVQKAKTAD